MNIKYIEPAHLTFLEGGSNRRIHWNGATLVQSGKTYIMSKPGKTEHKLDVDSTDTYRLAAHWKGYAA